MSSALKSSIDRAAGSALCNTRYARQRQRPELGRPPAVTRAVAHARHSAKASLAWHQTTHAGIIVSFSFPFPFLFFFLLPTHPSHNISSSKVLCIGCRALERKRFITSPSIKCLRGMADRLSGFITQLIIHLKFHHSQSIPSCQGCRRHDHEYSSEAQLH